MYCDHSAVLGYAPASTVCILMAVAMSIPASSSEGKKGVRWPGLSAPLPETKYGSDWFAKDLEMQVVEEGDSEVKWSRARISSDLPGNMQWVVLCILCSCK